MTTGIIDAEVTLTKGGFLFDHSTGLTYSLNNTGRFVFQRLRDGLDAATLLKELVAEFETTEETARNDLEDFIRQMKELGLSS